jgi:hypothetical protein
MGAHRPATCVVVFKLNQAQRGDNDDIAFCYKPFIFVWFLSAYVIYVFRYMSEYSQRWKLFQPRILTTRYYVNLYDTRIYIPSPPCFFTIMMVIRVLGQETEMFGRIFSLFLVVARIFCRFLCMNRGINLLCVCFCFRLMGNIPKCRRLAFLWLVGWFCPPAFSFFLLERVYCYYYDLTFLGGESLDITS